MWVILMFIKNLDVSGLVGKWNTSRQICQLTDNFIQEPLKRKFKKVAMKQKPDAIWG